MEKILSSPAFCIRIQLDLRIQIWINLALPVLKRIHHYIVDLFMLVSRNTFKLIMMYRILLPEIKYLMSYV
jgi:hypothetical protein